MKPTKKLVLKKETLAELTTDELQAVVAGAASLSGCHECPTLPVERCLSPVINDTIGCSLNLGCWTDGDCYTRGNTCICR